MSWTVHIRATHAEHRKVVEQALEACPAILGRDVALAGCVLEGDDSVSEVHASIDVRGNRLMVRDVRSTNGTYTATGRLEPDRWVDVGPAEAQSEIRIGGWRLRVRAMQSVFSTLAEPLPFGASQCTTTSRDAGETEVFASLAAVVDR